MSMTGYYREQYKHAYVAFKIEKNEKNDEQYVLYNRQTLQERTNERALSNSGNVPNYRSFTKGYVTLHNNRSICVSVLERLFC